MEDPAPNKKAKLETSTLYSIPALFDCEHNLPSEISQYIGKMVTNNNSLSRFLFESVEMPTHARVYDHAHFFYKMENLIDNYHLSSDFDAWADDMGTQKIWYDDEKYYIYLTYSKEYIVTNTNHDSHFQIWSRKAKSVILDFVLDPEHDEVRNLHFIPNSNILLIAATKKIEFIKLTTGKVLAKHENREPGFIDQVLINKNGDRIAVNVREQNKDVSSIIKIYSIENIHTLKQITNINVDNLNKIWIPSFKSENDNVYNDYILTESTNSIFNIYNAQTGKHVIQIPDTAFMDDKVSRKVLFDEKGAKILISEWDYNNAYLWKMPTKKHPRGEGLFIPSSDGNAETGAFFSPDYKKIISVNKGKSVHITCAQTGKRLFKCKNDDKDTCVQYCIVNNQGDLLMVVEANLNYISIYSLENGLLIRKISPNLEKEKDFRTTYFFNSLDVVFAHVNNFKDELFTSYDLSVFRNLLKYLSLDQAYLLQSAFSVSKLNGKLDLSNNVDLLEEYNQLNDTLKKALSVYFLTFK